MARHRMGPCYKGGALGRVVSGWRRMAWRWGARATDCSPSFRSAAAPHRRSLHRSGNGQLGPGRGQDGHARASDG